MKNEFGFVWFGFGIFRFAFRFAFYRYPNNTRTKKYTSIVKKTFINVNGIDCSEIDNFLIDNSTVVKEFRSELFCHLPVQVN